jgi:ariadne-1
MTKLQSDLEKYGWYYERYKNNEQAMMSAEKIRLKFKEEMKTVAIGLQLTLMQLEFLERACFVLTNCKRILKWSFVYGYYIQDPLQRNLYEIIQEKIDMFSSNLHVLLEKKYDTVKDEIVDFTKFKDQVVAEVFKCETVSFFLNFI